MTSTTLLQSSSTSLSEQQQAVVILAALAAAGDMPRLYTALDQALETGLTISELREVLVQLYAYAGFPRSLNALSELMRVLESRKQRGITDAPGHEPSRPIPQGDALLAAGTANQTKLSGSPVEGPLFDFAPIANQYLRAHLFGDIFERDNLDWQTRELATVGMLCALVGVEPQLQAHMRISMNTGITRGQLDQLCQTLKAGVDDQTGQRAASALQKHLASTAKASG
ncbi:carboxymuconolactone decarboxylase family protein [Pseudomonas sp. MN1F]|uniref:carboxymuconolactone decarboxylase family protein n=1 Tax=Pseudomonas sp. MN1F TaxID=1366632 RepID=UPI00128F222A|nr:carboxymuconolactone decarboxylase family protein [Pseudomonas sp. MN1F]MQG95533.1 carboxymuconolactone decarboxylase [Pseudomonas sp. MN1F]